MAIESITAAAVTTLGGTIAPGATSLTLSSPVGFPTANQVHLVLDPNTAQAEVVYGTISGANVTSLTRAAEAIGGVQTAFTHNAGGVVWLVLTPGALQNLFPQKIDEATGADFPAASITFPLHGAAFPAGGHLELIYDLRDTSAGTSTNNLQVQFNSDVGANYSQGQIYNSSTTAVAYNEGTAATSMVVGLTVAGGAAAGWYAKGRILIPNFSSAATVKQVLGNTAAGFGAGATGTQSRQADGTWNSVAAITAIKIFSASGNLAADSLITVIHWP